MSNSGGRAAVANSGNTGAPGESTLCANCHGGGSYSPSMSLAVTDLGGSPVVAYTPGETYNLTVTITASGTPAGYGFQMTSLQSSNSPAGSFSNPSSNAQISTISSGRTYVEHDGTSSSNTFTAQWTAPATNTGTVTMYANGNAVNGNGGTSGDAGTPAIQVTLTEAAPATVMADAATGVTIADGGDDNVITDVSYSFTAANDESTVSEYRLYLVPQGQVAAFDLVAASNSAATGFTTVAATGIATYSGSLASGTTDVNGTPFENGSTYALYVVSVADGTNANADALSSASGLVTFSTAIAAATNVSLSDIGNTNSAADLQVTFEAAQPESGFTSYFLYIVKSTEAASFDLSVALSSNLAGAVAPSGNAMYQTTFQGGATDAAGDAIVDGGDYVAFVVSVSTSDPQASALSSPSDVVQLRGTAQAAENVTASDIADNANAADVEVSYVVSGDEAYNSSYRVLLVPNTQAGAFTLAAAEAAPAERYTEVSAGSVSYQLALDATQLDVNGDAIVEDVAYAVFVLSVADTDLASENVLIGGGTVTLTGTVSLPPIPATVGRLWATGQRQLWVEWAQTGTYHLDLYDLQGRSVMHRLGEYGSSVYDLARLPAGVYIVRVRAQAHTYTQRIVVR